MNYYSPRQRDTDQRWDYTCENNKHVYPVGYCARYIEWTDEQMGILHVSKKDPQISKSVQFKDKYHTNGHDTAEEAAECYRTYNLDMYLVLGTEDEDTQKKCEVCGIWTQKFAHTNYLKSRFLCPEHMTRECYSKLEKAVYSTASSY